MRPIAVVLVVVAMVFAGMTAFVAKRWLDVQASRKPAAEVTAMLDVLVVARDVSAGMPLSVDDLRYDPWPLPAVTERFVIRKPGEDPRATFVGQVARRPLVAGEPFVPAASFKQDGSGVLAGVLAAGMRAVSVAITNASGVSGFIAPGDRVDVVMAADFQRADQNSVGKGGPFLRYAAETVLEDVKVLAIDQQMAKSKDKDGGAIVGKTATLEVSPKQAEVLTAAGMVGQLSLVLRGIGAEPAMPGEAPRVPFTGDTEASKAMKALMGGAGKPKAGGHTGGGSGVLINRGGDISNKSF